MSDTKHNPSPINSLLRNTQAALNGTFKGLSLEPEVAFSQIAAMIEVGSIISTIDMEDGSDLSDCIFILARQYAEAAHDAALENCK